MGELISYQEFLFRKFKKEISKIKTEQELKEFLRINSESKVPEGYGEKYKLAVAGQLSKIING